MSVPPYSRFGSPDVGGPIVAIASPGTVNITKNKRRGALICGIIQVTMGILFAIIGIAKAVEFIPSMGWFSFFGAIFAILAGSFGIQSSRTAGKCPTVACMVLSILGALSCVSALITDSFFLALARAYYSEKIQEAIIDSPYIQPLPVRIEPWFSTLGQGAYVMLIVTSLINFFAAIFQSAFACGMACSCCDRNESDLI